MIFEVICLATVCCVIRYAGTERQQTRYVVYSFSVSVVHRNSTAAADRLKRGGTHAPATFLIPCVTEDIIKPINKAATTTFKQLKTPAVHRGN